MKHLMAMAFTLCLLDTLQAQQPPPAPAPARPGTAAPARPGSARPAQPAPPAQAAPATPAPGSAPAPAPFPFANDPINVRYEITIRDEGGPQPNVKTVVMTATLYEISLVRSQAGPSPLNIDVNPTGLRDNKVRTKVGVEYTPAETSGGATPSKLVVRQSVHVWLESGKPVVISQSADPLSNRRLIVEATATIVK